MSVNTESTIDASKAGNAERTNETIAGVSPELIEDKIRANLEAVNAQIQTMTQLLDQLIQDNSAKITPTVGPRTVLIVRKLNPRSKEKLEPLKPCQEQ